MDRKRNKLEENFHEYSDSDENFAFIAGYTSGGFPYGVTWDEWEAMEKEEVGERSGFIKESMETDFDKIKKRAEESNDENWEFRSFLKWGAAFIKKD